MHSFNFLIALPLLMLAKTAAAVCGIHSFTTCDDGIVHWFDPLTGEICDPLDCGGGRAPPKTNVPGCPSTRVRRAVQPRRPTCPAGRHQQRFPRPSRPLPLMRQLRREQQRQETSDTSPVITTSAVSSTKGTPESTSTPLTTPPASLSTSDTAEQEWHPRTSGGQAHHD